MKKPHHERSDVASDFYKPWTVANILFFPLHYSSFIFALYSFCAIFVLTFG